MAINLDMANIRQELQKALLGVGDGASPDAVEDIFKSVLGDGVSLPSAITADGNPLINTFDSSKGGVDGKVNTSGELARLYLDKIQGKTQGEKISVMNQLFGSLSAPAPILQQLRGYSADMSELKTLVGKLEEALPSKTARDAFAKHFLGLANWDQVKELLSDPTTEKLREETAKHLGIDESKLKGLSANEMVDLLLMYQRKNRDEQEYRTAKAAGGQSWKNYQSKNLDAAGTAKALPGANYIAPTSEEAGKYKPLLDLIKSKESGSWGYEAMNQGGSDGGHVAHGSGHAKEILGKNLTDMTVREVMEHQAAGRLHAAGAYQIIGKTLKGLVERGVIKPDEKFDVAAQDRAGIALIEGRRGQGTTGIGNEWIGLQYVDKATLKAAMNTAGLSA